jgi:hypothetical protein
LDLAQVYQGKVGKGDSIAPWLQTWQTWHAGSEFPAAEVNMMNNKRPGCENLHVLSLNVCFDRMLQGFL